MIGTEMNRLTHTTNPSARETMEPLEYAANHARLLNLQGDPIALQRWAVEAQRLIQELVIREHHHDTLRASFDKLASAVGWTKERCEQTGDSPIDVAEALRAELEAIRAQQPVAYRSLLPSGSYTFCNTAQFFDNAEPVYAAPVASPDVGALVKALELIKQSSFNASVVAEKALDAYALTQSQAARVPDIESAAKKLSECMDYPWDHMPEKGRENMRKHAQAVIDAALKAAHGITKKD